MIVVPSSGIVIVPGVTYFFQKDYFEELAGKNIEKDSDVVFAVLKENKNRQEVNETDFYKACHAGKPHAACRGNV